MLEYNILVRLWGRASYFFKDFSFYLLLLFLSTAICVFFLNKIYHAKLSDRKKNFVLLSIFTFLSLVYIYSGFEAYFRYRFDQTDGLGFLQVTSHWYARHVTYNNYQYRDNKNWTIEKPQGQVRIGVMGDSNTFGYGIKDVNKRFSNLLETKLIQSGYNVEVDNFGVPGLGTEGDVKEYRRVKNLNFDILIWQYFLNNAEEATRSAGTKVLQHAQAEPPGVITFLSDHSFFFDYIYWRLAAKYEPVFIKIRNADLEQYNIPEVFQHHKSIIDAFTYDLEGQNKKIIVLMIPFLYFFPNYPANAIEIHRRMDTIFINDGVTKIVDLYDYVKGKNSKDLTVSRFDSHPNEYVNSIAADKLYDAIVPLLINAGYGKTYIKK